MRTRSITPWQQWNAIVNHSAQQPAPMPAPYREPATTERQAAFTRARSILESVLQPDQKAELERDGHFHVRGSRGRRYRICGRGQSGNVHLLDDAGAIQARLCAHPGGPDGHLPDPDAWLAQMLALMTDEDRFLLKANVHQGRLPSGLVSAGR